LEHPIRSETQILEGLGFNILDLPLLHVSDISKSRLKAALGSDYVFLLIG
jgi:hypothetical protein